MFRPDANETHRRRGTALDLQDVTALDLQDVTALDPQRGTALDLKNGTVLDGNRDGSIFCEPLVARTGLEPVSSG
jgi:hypothetical protein